MNKVKAIVLLFTAFLAVNGAKAQTIEEGREFLYYEKYISAKNVFQKMVDANPGNIDAVYWLGQAMIAPKDEPDIAGAKALYRKTLMANSNAPMLIAGMGHVELLEGNTQDARNQFETAISLSQGKSAAVLNAVGFANSDYESKSGDAGYAIDKLKQALALKAGSKDPDIYCNLGDAYRKLADGSNAQLSYESALSVKPNYARAKYRNGRIYQTQGSSQEEIFMRYYNEAIAMDPRYTPVYFTLFNYFYNTNVTRSAEYLEKYLTAKGADEPNSCYYRAAIKYAQGLYADAIAKCDECIAAAGATPYPKLFGVKAYAAYKLGDSVNAKTGFDQYFQKENPNKIGPLDYRTYALVLLKFPGNETLAGTFIDKSVSLDTTEADKVTDLKSIASVYESRKQYKDAADWYRKIVNVRAMPTRVDLFNAGYNYYRSADPQTCITIFSIYTQKYPDDILGYYWVGKASWVIDSTMTLGMANPSFGKVIQLGEPMPDKSKIKIQLMTAYRFMVVYYANIRKDRDSALYYCDRALAVDPTDQETLTNKDVISKSPMKPAPKAGVTTVNSKGEKVTVGADGSVTTIAKDGSSMVVTRDGKVTTVKNGVTTIIENGKITTIDKDGKTSTEKLTVGADGSVTAIAKDGSSMVVTKDGKVTTLKNGVTTIIENGKITTIDKDGKTTTVPAPPKQNIPAPGAPKKK